MANENPDIIIVDDDPMVGELSRDLLTDEGYKVLLIQDSMEAISTIKHYKPRLVIADIMMPGITGMDICKELKSDPLSKNIKVIIASGKAFLSEKQKAFQLGADFFLQKPYDVNTFSKTVKDILEETSSAPPPPPSAPIQIISEEETIVRMSDLTPGTIRLQIWGARGLPSVIPNSPSKYGRQTSCISVETKDNLFILDAGTGIIPLGKEIITKKTYYKDIWIFITHFHLDHIIGLGNFPPIQNPNFSIHIAGANDPERSLKQMAQSAFYSSYSLAKQPPKAKIDLYELLEDNYELMPGIKLTTMYANHPTSTLIYSFEMFGKKIVYAPDSEIWGEATAFQDYDERLGIFSKDADIFIHDVNYNDKDYETHNHEGHSGLSVVLDFAAKANVKDFVMFHLNPSYSDEDLDKMCADAQNTIKTKGYTFKCHMATESKTFLL